MDFAQRAGQEIKVYLETPDGQVFTGKALAAEISHNYGEVDASAYGDYSGRTFTIPTRPEWNIDLRGRGDLTLTQGGDVAFEIAKRILPREWQCEYCGRANSIKAQQCGSCGWYRGLITDVVQECGVWRLK